MRIRVFDGGCCGAEVVSLRPYILPALFVLSAPLLWASPGSLVITVVDQDISTPLEGVRLTVRGVPGSFQTGADGAATVALPAGSGALLVTAQLPGYEPAKAVARAGETKLLIKMALAGEVGGSELVVEQPRPNVSEGEAGVSEVVTKNDITDTTMGVVQDIMSTIKMLPGVGYTSTFNAEPSIQGGNPNELQATLDGAYVLYPYQWGGAVSIFNPDMVESAELSDGIVSARYGQFLSGLLEVNSITPTQTQPTVDFDLSTSEVDLFASAPIGNNAGLYFGGTQTWLQVPLALFGESRFAPYITDGFGKLYWDPSPSVKWFLDTSIDTDGVTINNSSSQAPTPPNTLTTSGSGSYSNSEVLLASGAKLLLTNDLLLNLLASFNNHDLNFSGQSVANGTEYYSQSFINTYGSMLGGATSFTLNDLTSSVSESTDDYLYQGKVDLDWQPAEGQLLSFGVEELLRDSTTDENVNTWQTVFSGGTPEFVNVVSNVSTSDDNTLTSAFYADYSFSLWRGLLKGEAGVRANYTVVYNADMTLLTLPSVDPRIRLTLTPIRNSGAFQSISFVGGTGLFSEFPVDSPYIDTQYGVSNYQIGPERAWFNELGVEAVTKDGWKLDVDGYYKDYFDRFYVVADDLANPVTYSLYDDGVGFATGVDALIQRSTRYWEGWLSYSFVVTRLYNPDDPGNTDTAGDPTGIWYYPSYNSENDFSLVLTLKPTSGFSFTVEAQVASGTPLSQLGPITPYIAELPDGTYVERYAQTSTYSDTLRTGWSYPVDLKASWHGFYRGTKIGWEFYLAVQDVFAMLYTAAANGNPPFDPWTGATLTGTSAASYDLGFPIPSIGFDVTY